MVRINPGGDRGGSEQNDASDRAPQNERPVGFHEKLFNGGYKDLPGKPAKTEDEPSSVTFGPLYAGLIGVPRNPSESYPNGVTDINDWRSSRMDERIKELNLTGTEKVIHKKMEETFVNGNYKDFADLVLGMKKAGNNLNSEEALRISLDHLGYYATPTKSGLEISPQYVPAGSYDSGTILKRLSLNAKTHQMLIQFDEYGGGKLKKHELVIDVDNPKKTQSFVTELGSGQSLTKKSSTETLDDYSKIGQAAIEPRILEAKRKILDTMRERYKNYLDQQVIDKANEAWREQQEQRHRQQELDKQQQSSG